MNRIHSYNELSPAAKRRAIRTHAEHLSEYHRLLLNLIFSQDLRQAGYPNAVPIFEPDLMCLLSDGVVVEGADITPSMLDRLTLGGLKELSTQLQTEKLEADILISGIQYFGNGIPARTTCPTGMCCYYGGMLYFDDGESLWVPEYLMTTQPIKEDVLLNIVDELNICLSRPGTYLSLDQFDEVCNLICLSWSSEAEGSEQT